MEQRPRPTTVGRGIDHLWFLFILLRFIFLMLDYLVCPNSFVLACSSLLVRHVRRQSVRSPFCLGILAPGPCLRLPARSVFFFGGGGGSGAVIGLPGHPTFVRSF